MATSLRQISPDEIQSELGRLWEALETKGTTRACLINLVFYVPKSKQSAYMNKIAQKVVEKFPSRVIFVSVDKEASQDFLHTKVSILPSSKGEMSVACDYIEIEAGGPSQVKIPFVVMPHLLPDLPVYLVWAEDPSQDNPLSHQLERFANRLIFDSEATDHLPRFAKAVLGHAKDTGCDVADLNWARIETWRDMLSQVFYSEEKLQQLNRSQSIKIVYNAQETPFFCHTKIQAIYLQSWLSSRLQWKIEALRIDGETLVFSYRSLEKTVQIEISPDRCVELPPGILLSLEIITSEEEHFLFQRDRAALHRILLNCSTREKCELPTQYIFPRVESGHSLVKEICHRGTSEHYLNVLKLIEQMDGFGLC